MENLTEKYGNYALFGAKITQRKKGGIIFVSSTFSHQSAPFSANYYTSKAYIVSIGQALNYKLRKSKVYVYVLSTGFTKTELHSMKTDNDFTKMLIVEMNVEPVVKKTLKLLCKSQATIPVSWKT